MVNLIQQKYNQEYLSQIFDGEISIIEDLTGSKIKLYRKSSDSQWVLQKSGGRDITEIDRTLMIYYNYIYDHIFAQELENIDSEIETIYLTYLYQNTFDSITYPTPPESKLIISHILDFDGNEITKYDKISEILNVGKPPIIFNGKLNKPKKEKIIEVLFKYNNTKKVIKNILSIVNPTLKPRIHNLNSIHNIIFKTSENDFFARLFNFNSKDKNSTQDDYYTQILIDFVNFIHSKDLFRYKISGNNYNELYISLISKMFNQFIDSRGHLFQDLEFNKPDFMTHDSFELSKRFINNLDTIEYLNNKTYKEIYKILLNSFKKEKGKNHGLFNERIRNFFNQTVKSIKNRINKSLVNESTNEHLKTYFEYTNQEKIIVEDNFNPFTIDKIDKLSTIYEKYQKPIYLKINDGSLLENQMCLDIIDEYFFLHSIVSEDNINSQDILINMGNIKTRKKNGILFSIPSILHKYLK